MKEKMSKEFKKQLADLLDAGEMIGKKTIRSLSGTEFERGEGKTGSRNQQINLDGLCSFRLPANTEQEIAILERMVPGRTIIFSFTGITQAEGDQNFATSTGSNVKAPAKFTNYQDVTVLFIGKSEALEVDFDDDLEDAKVTLEFTKKKGGFQKKTDIPDIPEEEGTKGEDIAY